MLRTGDQADQPKLTLREREIVELVACGLSAKQIAQEVGIAPRTVERHVENCRHKMRARNKTQMIAKAIAFGELPMTTVPAGPDSPAPTRFKPHLVVGR